MELSTILLPGFTLCKAPANSKKRTLELVAEFMCERADDLSADDVFMRLIERERSASTGLGRGVAIPHCRIPMLQSLVAALVTLDEAIEFDAIDAQPVDIMFALLVPEESFSEHLETLAMLAGLFNQDSFCNALRSAKTDEDLLAAALQHSEQ